MLQHLDLPVSSAGRDLDPSLAATGGPYDTAAASRHASSALRAPRVLAASGYCAYRRGWQESRASAAPLGARRAGDGEPATSALRQVTEDGSQTTEYALLLIVAATITMLALTWAKQGAIKGVLDGVIGQVLALFGIGAG